MKRRTALLGAAAGLVIAAVPDWFVRGKDQATVTVKLDGQIIRNGESLRPEVWSMMDNSGQHFDIFEERGMLHWHHQYDPGTRKGTLLLPINNGYPHGEPDLPEDVEIDIEPLLTSGSITDARMSGGPWGTVNRGTVGQPYDADVNNMRLLVHANFFENFRGLESGLVSGIGAVVTKREGGKITNIAVREVIIFPSEYQK